MLFAPKKVDPTQQAREWKRQINSQKRSIDREILSINRAEKKVTVEIKKAASRGDMASAKILAKEVAQSRKAKDRLYTSKAHLNSIGMQLQSSLASIRIAGCMQQSAVVMQSMNQLIKLPEMHKIMLAMGREMEKAGLIEELMEDMFDDMEDEGIEEAANEEVEKVFLEVTQGILEHGGRVGSKLEAKEDQQNKEAIDMLSRLEVPST